MVALRIEPATSYSILLELQLPENDFILKSQYWKKHCKTRQITEKNCKQTWKK